MYENVHHPTLLGPDGMTSLREYAGYHGVAADLVGSCGRGIHRVKVWSSPAAQLYPWQCPRGRSGTQNGYAANAIQLHQDHIVGSFFGSVIAQAGAIWASGRKKPVLFPRG